MRAMLAATFLGGLAAFSAAGEEVRLLGGHGGPIMSLAVSHDGERLLSASFDYSVGLRAFPRRAPVWLEGHDAAVNTVIFLDAAKAASGGDDGAIILWDLASGNEAGRLRGHSGKVMSLAVTPDGATIASAGWDGRAGLWDAANATHLRWIEGHAGRVNDVAFAQDGRLYTASDDGTVRSWDTSNGSLLRIATDHGFGVNRLVLDPRGRWIAYGSVDGRVRVIERTTGETVTDLMPDRGPVLAMALRPDARLLAAGFADGHVMLLETAGWSVVRMFRASSSGPIWALAFTPDGTLLSGGLDSAISLWPERGTAAPGDLARQPFHRPPDTMPNGERQFVRKCSICHSLGAAADRHAGPPLGGLFGRRAGGFAGYAYSPVLADADLVWSEATVDALFRLGPDRVVPGSKMPLQRITAERDRRDLIAYLKAATRVPPQAPSKED